jgi:hypothetical protein
MRLKGLMIAAGVWLLAAPVFAGDGTCLWKAAPQASRDTVLATALQDPEKAADLAQFFKGLDGPAMFKSCGVSSAAIEPPLYAFSGYLFQVSAARWLEANKVATTAQLEAGWDGIDPAVRRAVIDNAATLSKEPLPPEAFKQFTGHTGAANLDGPGFQETKPGRYVLMYLLGRAVRAANEAKF